MDIIVEGDMLDHCLRGGTRYWDRIQIQESYILFLRRTSAPDTPYYTLEIEFVHISFLIGNPKKPVRKERRKMISLFDYCNLQNC